MIQRLYSFWFNLPIRSKGAAVISIPVVCLVTSLAIFAGVQRKVVEAQHRVEHTYKVRQQTGEILNLLIDAETGVRSYSLSKQPEFLQPYTQALSKLPSAEARLRQLVSDNPSQVDRYEKIHRLINQRKIILAQTLKLVNTSNDDANTTIIQQLNRGRTVMNSLRGELDNFNQVEQRLLIERQKKLQGLEKIATRVLWIAGFIGIAGGFTANYLYSLGIVKRMGKLQDNAQRLAQGEQLATLIPGQDEISRLDLVLHSTAAQIAKREAKLRQANALIAEAAKKEKALIENSLDVICSIDADGRFVEVSPACLKLWGYESEELVGRPYIELVVPEDVQKTQTIAAEIMSGKEVSGFENRYTRPDGSCVEIVWSAVWSQSEQLMFCVARDNTEQKEIERLKNDLISTVNHELRTPLTSLRGFSEILLKKQCKPEKQQQYLKIIYDESKRLGNLINDFLDIQRMESGKQNYNFEPINISILVEETLELFSHTSNEHTLNISAPLELPQVKADRDRIHQVLSNLVSNAIKYSPNGGEVTVSAYEQDTEIVVSVADTGVGISQQAMEKLFTKFYRVDNASTRRIGGTGLGLAIVKEIVEAHRGRVWVESTPGEGSTFYFSLPKVVQKPPLPEQSITETIDILLVEDDPIFAQLLQNNLEHLGFTVGSTAFAEQALQLIEQHLPRLIFLDILLPGDLDGWDFLIAIKSNRKLVSLPVLILTITEPNIRGLALKGADYLPKPVAPEVFLDAVQYHLPKLSGKTLLIADDDQNFRQQVIENLKSEADIHFIEATNGKEALEQIKQQMPDLLILDLLMPEIDGFEVLRQLRADKHALNLPVLVVTGAELSIEEKAYLKSRMAILVNKQETCLEALTKIVEETLGVLPQLNRSTSLSHDSKTPPPILPH